MKYRLILTSLTIGCVAILTLSTYLTQQKSQAFVAPAGPTTSEAVSSEEKHQTYQLAPGARVDVSFISGPVSVEATAAGQTAEVHIYRSAPNSADLAYRKVLVEQTSAGLTIRQKTGGTEPSKVNLLNRVVLRLPRNVSLSAKSIGGGFSVNGIGGTVELNSVSGDVRLSASSLTDAGIRVSDVSGKVYLQLASGLNAELSISNTTGGVSNKVSGLVLDQVDSSSYLARLGAGGPRIVVTNITGEVVIERL